MCDEQLCKTEKQNYRCYKHPDSKIGIFIQSIGLVFLGFGIVLEIVYKADIYFLGITIGSVVFTIGTKIRRR